MLPKWLTETREVPEDRLSHWEEMNDEEKAAFKTHYIVFWGGVALLVMWVLGG